MKPEVFRARLSSDAVGPGEALSRGPSAFGATPSRGGVTYEYTGVDGAPDGGACTAAERTTSAISELRSVTATGRRSSS